MHYLLALTILLAPAYAVRFPLFGFPANLLMVWIFCMWIVFCVLLTKNRQWRQFVSSVSHIPKKILGLTILFYVAGIISLYTHGITPAKYGQFVVLFLQPVVTFLVAHFVLLQYPQSKTLLLRACYCTVALLGGYAIVQYLTRLGLPVQYWGNSVEPKRAVSVFSHPNFYSLFSAPLLALLVPDLFQTIKTKLVNLKTFAWLVGAGGLFFSLSRAGWLGLGIAVVVYVVLAGNKRIRTIAAVSACVLFIIIAVTPNFRYRLLLPFYGEKSSVSRMSLWHTGVKAITESPVEGLGLTGFATNWSRLNTDPNLESHNFPHNIFLNFWVESGLLGLVSFVGILCLLLYYGFKNRANAIVLGVGLFAVALLFQGQIDNPYFKNDLALLFWLAVALATSTVQNYENKHSVE